MVEYVDVAAARAAGGVRMVVASSVPSPWSEAAKGLFHVAGIPVLAVRNVGDLPAIQAWAGTDNVPVVLHGVEPARTSYAQIVGLAARLAPGVLVPEDPAARAELFGTLELLAGEQGLGWSARLVMIHTGIETEGKRGFAVPIARYLAARYGYAGVDIAAVRARVTTMLRLLGERLGGREYFGGDRPDARDIYAATFLTPLTVITDEACPAFRPSLRAGFAAAADELAAIVPAELFSLRTRMFERHLAWPIAL